GNVREYDHARRYDPRRALRKVRPDRLDGLNVSSRQGDRRGALHHSWRALTVEPGFGLLDCKGERYKTSEIGPNDSRMVNTSAVLPSVMGR
ncbi:MAG: hypothetical protein AAFY15_11370, partial [Cyanobacteria bacterium J06648_11]